MSNPQRRKELEAERERGDIARRREERRKADLNMYMRIAEAAAVEIVKEILHMLAEKLHME